MHIQSVLYKLICCPMHLGHRLKAFENQSIDQRSPPYSSPGAHLPSQHGSHPSSGSGNSDNRERQDYIGKVFLLPHLTPLCHVQEAVLMWGGNLEGGEKRRRKRAKTKVIYRAPHFRGCCFVFWGTAGKALKLQQLSMVPLM